MNRLPQRTSLVHQLSQILADEVRAGRWGEWLPEERELARNYQVSRYTVRKALAQLRAEGVLQTQHGLGTRIAPLARTTQRKPSESIGVLIPHSLDRFRHFTTLFVDDLRTLLIDHGLPLAVHEHPQVEARRPFEFLKKLTGQQRHACWLLVGCGLATQRWFSEHGIAAVVSGTCDASLGLPFVCLDNHALGRHAGLTLLQHGHRRVGALLTHSNPGLRTGLHDAMGPASGSEATLLAYEVDDTVASIARVVDRLMAATPRPSALFAAESNIYLTAFARLTQLRLRIPEDISLLCRDDEPYLASLLPIPARYSKNPHAYAKRLLTHILKVTNHEPILHPGIFVMPEFVTGASLRRATNLVGK